MIYFLSFVNKGIEFDEDVDEIVSSLITVNCNGSVNGFDNFAIDGVSICMQSPWRHRPDKSSSDIGVSISRCIVLFNGLAPYRTSYPLDVNQFFAEVVVLILIYVHVTYF